VKADIILVFITKNFRFSNPFINSLLENGLKKHIYQVPNRQEGHQGNQFSPIFPKVYPGIPHSQVPSLLYPAHAGLKPATTLPDRQGI